MNLVYKICFFILIFLAQISVSAQGKWNKIEAPTHAFLKSVFFPDSLYGWAAGDSGTIVHTSDGGKTWVLQNSGTKDEITALFFLDRNRGWASSINFSVSPFGTLLLKTTNGGANWTDTPYPDSNIFITCILFRDSLNGWMGGRPNALVKTTNGGVTWTQAEIDTSGLAFMPVLSIKFYNDKYGYACGGVFDVAGVVWRTSNGGDRWSAMDPSEAPADEVHELYLYDSLHVIGAGGDPDYGNGVGMIRTSDGGLNWNYQQLGIQGTAYDIDFRNQSEAWSPLGTRGTLIYSMDGGNTWTEIPAPDSAAIFQITFPDSLHGWAVGRDGAVLKYNPPLPGGINPGQVTNPLAVILHQNSPNPFYFSTDIRFEIPVDMGQVPVTIKVYNFLGAEVSTLVDAEFPPGIHEVTFNAMDLPEGVYFYRLSGNTSGKDTPHVAPRKMILMK